MSNDDFDFWGNSDSSGEYEAPAGDSFEPLPDGTKCLAIIDKIEWKSFDSDEGEAVEYIDARWCVIKPADYENRKIFHKIKLYGDDPKSKFYEPEKQEKKIEKERNMFWAIDKNAGAKLAALKRKPTEEELQRHLINKPMHITLRLWESKDKTASGNWIQKIEPANAQQKEVSKPINSQKNNDPDDEDLPF